MTDDERLEADARRAVLVQLARAREHFDRLEEMAKRDGRFVEAEGAHQHGVWLLRAWCAEMDNPPPKEPAEMTG